MTGIESLRGEKIANAIDSHEHLNGRISSQSCLVRERRRQGSSPIVKLIAIALVAIIVVFLVGAAIVSTIVISLLRQLQNRVETLEGRVQYLEGDKERFPQEAEVEDISNNVFSIHTPRDLPAAWKSPSRKKRTLRKSSQDHRSKITPKKSVAAPLASIHMEMVSGHQRRKRKNSNHLLWKVSDWVPQRNRDNYKLEDSEELAGIGVKRKGLYFIYAQVVFRNLGMNNIVSIKTSTREFSRCYDGVDHVDDTSEKLKTCYTGTMALVEANETVTVHNLYGHEIHTESISNFFGLIKLSDIP